MQARLLLQLLSSLHKPCAPSTIRAHRSSKNRRSSEAGFSFALVLTLLVGLLAASLGLAFRGSSGLLNSANQSLNREATAVAEEGINAIMAELGKPPNRRMLVSGKPINQWNNTPDPLQQNPCLVNTTNPFGTQTTTSAQNIASNTYVSIDTAHRYILRRVRYSADSTTSPITPRANSVDYKFTSPNSGNTIQTSTTGVFSNANHDLINLKPNALRDNVGYFEVEVQGQVLNASGTPMATATVIKEFQVVPKCCDRSFNGPYSSTFPPTATNSYGNDRRLCKGSADMGLVYGFNNGSLTSNGQAGTFTSVDFFGNVIGLPGLICIADPYSSSYNPTTTCKDKAGGTYNSYVPAQSPPQVNIYPALTNTDAPPTFASLFPTSTKVASNITSAYYFKATATRIDRYSVGLAPGGIADNPATTEVDESKVLTSANTSLWTSSCEKAATGSKAKTIADYHCRIGKIDYNNGDLIFDTSQGSIAFYFDDPMSGSSSPGIKITGSTTFSHRLCTTSYAATAVCSSSAPPKAFRRLNFFSNRSDAVFYTGGTSLPSASMFIYMNNGSVSILGNASNISGAIWTKNLTISGSFTSAASTVDCNSDTIGFCYVAADGSTPGAPLFDWQARSISRSRMYAAN